MRALIARTVSVTLVALGLVAALESCAGSITESDPIEASTAGSASCPADFVVCGGACTDLASDRDHCGKCGTSCAVSELCEKGKCVVSCAEGEADCDGVCVELGSDEAHCGECGKACEAGFVCDGMGACALSCQAGLTDCSGKCVDLTTSNQHCGVCGLACEAGFVCDGKGVCAASCQKELVTCEGKCIDPTTDEKHCGASTDCLGPNAGKACLPGEFCIGAGVCSAPCPLGQLLCAGQCVDPNSNVSFCGALGNCQGLNAGKACLPGEGCVQGKCQSAPGSCQLVNGVQWCYHPTECGHACATTCAALGKALMADTTKWFEAQDTAAECQAISVAFGLGNQIDMNS